MIEMKFCGRIHSKTLAYASTTLGATMMNSVFMFYYVKIYLNYFHVSEFWFQASQIVFMIWNALNDPLFGYFQDNFKSYKFLKSRRESILYGAPLFALSFILTWFPWGTAESPPWIHGLQLMFVLCFYDALFTFVLLAHCALFAELSTDQEDRVNFVRFSQVASLIGSSSVLFCETASESLNSFSFQICCVTIGVVSFFLFVYTGLNAHTEFDLQQLSDQNISCLGNSPSENHNFWSFLTPACQIFRQQSFVSFVLTNFCQIYHTTYLANFAAIICDRLVSDSSLSKTARSTFYGALFLTPQILIILGSPIVTKFGYYTTIKASFIIKIIMGLMLFISGPYDAWLIIVFFLLDCGCSGATFSLFNLCLSDIIDIDASHYKRRNPLSSMVFGLNALVTKPSVALAPMITVAVFSLYGYNKYDNSSSSVTETNANLDPLFSMFHMTCFVPVIIGLIQLFLWSFYTIRDSHKSSYKISLPHM